MKKFKQKYGEYALVTGASSGIGKEFAIQLAHKGLNLVLVARRENMLQDLSSELQNKFHIKVETIALDLLQNGAVDALVSKTSVFEIGLLVLSAGMELHGSFLKNQLVKETDVVKLNTLIPMQLAHHFGKKMEARKRGGILFVSSTFGHQSVPYFANYSATKAYILTIGQALNYELKRSNVDVTVLSPGLTRTEMVDKMTDVNFKKMPITEMSVTPVVKKALNALGRKQAVIPGARNNFMDIMGKFTTPRWMLTNMFGFLVSRSLTTK